MTPSTGKQIITILQYPNTSISQEVKEIRQRNFASQQNIKKFFFFKDHAEKTGETGRLVPNLYFLKKFYMAND